MSRHRCSCRLCQRRQDKQTAFVTRVRKARRLAGLCAYCGGVPHPDRRKCDKCNRKKIAYQKRRAVARLAAGLCVYCGKVPPVPGKAGCQKDLDDFKRNAQTAKVRRRIMERTA